MRRFKSPFASASEGGSVNKVNLPQETIDDLRKLGPAADKR
jgi:hypothetical protein